MFRCCILFIALFFFLSALAQQKRASVSKKNGNVSSGAKKSNLPPTVKKGNVPPTVKKGNVPPGSKKGNISPLVKLNQDQIEHLKLYREISNAMAAGKGDRKSFIKQYYEVIAKSADELKMANLDKSDEMKIRAGEALDNNNERLSQKCNEAAELYATMAKELEPIADFYKDCKKVKLDACIKNYLDAEARLINLGARPCSRRWISTKEAEKYLITMYSKQNMRQK